MKSALYGRVVFGASAILVGIVLLSWHDSDTYQNLRKIYDLPLGASISSILAAALIVGGVGMIFPQMVRLGSLLVGAAYAIYSLACIPGMFAAPKAYVQYGSFFEQFSVAVGAFAAYAATEADAARTIALGRVARIAFGICTISFALAQWVYFRFTASLVPTWLPPNQAFWTALTTIAFGLAAIATLINVRARLALRLEALMVALFGVIVWIPILIAHPAMKVNWAEFGVTFIIAGGALLVADVTPSPQDDKVGALHSR